MWAKREQSGFTLVELLIVVVIIGVLAAITVVAYSGITTRANNAKIAADISTLEQAMLIAEHNTSSTSLQITGVGPCCAGGAGTCCETSWTTPPANCISSWNNFLNKISDASNIDVRGMLDPWGNPYVAVQLESTTDCRHDELYANKAPTSGWSSPRLGDTQIPFSGFSGC